LEEYIIAELKDITNFQINNHYTAQTLLLGGVPGKFYVRANVWLPKHLLHGINTDGERRLFSYDFAHHHNFDFATVGYIGSGYETDVYEYDSKKVNGNIGEEVKIRFLESTTLPQHKVMIYRAGRDIHVQKLPTEFSVSINLLAPACRGEQFAFDLQKGQISNLIRSNFAGQRWLIEAASYLCNDNISDVLHTIALTHSSSRTRDVARTALAVKFPKQA
jgi:hypothetical protein